MDKYYTKCLFNIFLIIIFDQMGKKSDITQAKIASTAKDMFLEKGFDGVKMQELADRAGVNKGLLHHYFHNKKYLFDVVFTEAFNQLFSKFEAGFSSSTRIDLKINAVVDAYFDMLLANPKLPIFVFFELHKNPALLQNLITMDRIGLLVAGFTKDDPKITREKAIHIILTIVSLSVFPFMAKPIVLNMVENENNFIHLIEERRPLVKKTLSYLVKSL